MCVCMCVCARVLIGHWYGLVWVRISRQCFGRAAASLGSGDAHTSRGLAHRQQLLQCSLLCTMHQALSTKHTQAAVHHAAYPVYCAHAACCADPSAAAAQRERHLPHAASRGCPVDTRCACLACQTTFPFLANAPCNPAWAPRGWIPAWAPFWGPLSPVASISCLAVFQTEPGPTVTINLWNYPTPPCQPLHSKGPLHPPPWDCDAPHDERHAERHLSPHPTRTLTHAHSPLPRTCERDALQRDHATRDE